jgi:tellurite resistance protein TerC
MSAGAPLLYWIVFFIVVGLVIAFDLVLLGRKEGAQSAGTHLAFFLFVVALAAALGFWLAHTRGSQSGLEFASGYLIEFSLSIDNLFVFLVMFRSFGMDTEKQETALTAGITGSIVMRALFMFFGIALLNRFSWIEYVFGAFLLFAAARLLRKKEKSEDAPERPKQLVKRWVAWLPGDWAASPQGIFFSAVVAIELVDLAFALDSIPAVLAVTRDPFIAYTSNILAVLGLRSLYFLLAGLLERLRYLHFGLAAILAFVGLKMIAARWVQVSVGISLGVIVGTVAIAAAASLLAAPPAQREPS